MAKLTRKIAQEQAARLAVCPLLLPQTTEGLTELVDGIMRHCADEHHARRTMTAVLDKGLNVRNVVAEIASAAALSLIVLGRAPAGCSVCDEGKHPTIGEQSWAPYVSAEDAKGRSFAARCKCARGRWLAECDRQRTIQAQPKDPLQQRVTVMQPRQIDVRAVASGELETG